jgi:hypothetical protein
MITLQVDNVVMVLVLTEAEQGSVSIVPRPTDLFKNWMLTNNVDSSSVALVFDEHGRKEDGFVSFFIQFKNDADAVAFKLSWNDFKAGSV